MFLGLAIALLLVVQIIRWGLSPLSVWPLLAEALLLSAGAFATYRRLSWGPPLLAGAWGIMIGVFVGTDIDGTLNKAIDPSWGNGSYSVDLGVFGFALAVAPLVALVGMTLAILGGLKSVA